MTTKKELKEMKKCRKAAHLLTNVCFKYLAVYCGGPCICIKSCPMFSLCEHREQGFNQPPLAHSFKAMAEYLDRRIKEIEKEKEVN